MSNLINKMKNSMHKDRDTDPDYSSHGQTTTDRGDYVAPRGTHVTNNPGRDSGYGTSNYGNQSTSPAYENQRAPTTGYDNPQSKNAGPHSSNLVNKVDPRIDSDMSKTQRTHDSGYEDYNNPRSTNAGPHASNIANRADPRIDSDMSKERNYVPGSNTGYGNNTSGGIGGNNHHNSERDYNTPGSATKAGYGNNTSGVTGGNNNQNSERDYNTLGSATNTGYGNNDGTTRKSVLASGPHNSSLMNKLDPRVDSDNSKDSNRTGYGTTGTGSGLLGSSNTKDHSTHHSGAGTTEHDTHHTGQGTASSNIETTSGPGSKTHDTLKHTTRHEGGGTYDSAASHRSGPDHHDQSRTHHSGPGLHESNVIQNHDGPGSTTSTTHTSTHTSGGNY